MSNLVKYFDPLRVIIRSVISSNSEKGKVRLMRDSIQPKGLQRTSLMVADSCHEQCQRCVRSERNADGVDKRQERE